jgi:hypothetical protein
MDLYPPGSTPYVPFVQLEIFVFPVQYAPTLHVMQSDTDLYPPGAVPYLPFGQSKIFILPVQNAPGLHKVHVVSFVAPT